MRRDAESTGVSWRARRRMGFALVAAGALGAIPKSFIDVFWICFQLSAPFTKRFQRAVYAFCEHLFVLHTADGGCRASLIDFILLFWIKNLL